MKITDNAKLALQDVIKSKGGDALKLTTKSSEGGSALSLEVATIDSSDRVVEINGINIIVEEQLEKMLEFYVFDYNNERQEFMMSYDGPHHCHCHHDHDNCDGDCDCNHSHDDSHCNCHCD